jgi:hypothetical protein
MTLLDLANLWENLDHILTFLPTKNLVSFANINKKSLKLVQRLFKSINESHDDYGFIVGENIKYKLPHEKCLLKIWSDRGHDLQHKSNNFFGGNYSYQFANDAIIEIVTIKQISNTRIKVWGWVLSGYGTYMMRGIKGKEYFRPYPIWTYITINTYKRFKLMPGLMKLPDHKTGVIPRGFV